MSREVALVIDGTKADVDQDTSFAFVYSIESTEPGKVAGSYYSSNSSSVTKN
jgi:hypothetical protein